MKKTLAVLMTLLILAMLIVSCDGSADSPVIHKVTFDSDNGSIANVKEVVDGENVPKPNDPEKTGYTFLGWYDVDTDTLFDFDTPVKKDYSLKARWQILTFTVSFETNSSGVTVEAQTIGYGCTIDTAKVPEMTKSNYTFMGWYKGSEKFDLNNPITENTTLTAKWGYKVTFYPDNGEAPTYVYLENEGTIAEGTVENPKKKSFAFKGWYTNPEDETTKFKFGETQVTADGLNLTAKWNQTYTCIVDYNRAEDGIPNEYHEVEHDYVFKFTDKFSGDHDWDITYLATEYNVKYEFIGWYYNGNLYKPKTDDWTNLKITVTEPVILTARWADKEAFYTVEFFDTNGTTELLSKAKVEQGKAVYIPTTPYKEGYVFDCWTKDGQPYDVTSYVYGNITLKASWKEVKKVTFIVDGETYTVEEVAEGDKVTTVPDAPTKLSPSGRNYNFMGWYNGSEKFDFDNTPITDNITLTAKWGYKVTFDSNGGSTVVSQVVEEGSSATKPAKNPTKDNSIFDKWTTDEAGENVYDFTSGVSGDLTLYAQWTTLVAGKTVLYLGTSGGQPIPWIVLDIDNTNKRALLFSQNVLEKQSFYNADINKKYFHYYSSTIHTRLKFYFPNEYGLNRNYMCNVDVGGEDTNVGSGDEKVFLLSSTEAKKYFTDDTARSGANVSWWLRTTAYNFKICYVSTSGSIKEGNDGMDPHNTYGIRPAFWLNLESPVSFSNNH